jgi:hypothetical protein
LDEGGIKQSRGRLGCREKSHRTGDFGGTSGKKEQKLHLSNSGVGTSAGFDLAIFGGIIIIYCMPCKCLELC